MALEVNGTPLKFVATFDGKKAEADIDTFLRNVSSKGSRNLQDFQPASKVIDDIVKKQKESITTSAAARDSFMGLTDALKSVHTDMAKVKTEITGLTATQKSLDRALKDNVISEDSYIKKTAELSARRTELNEILKKNREELKQYQLIAERSKNKPYTQADIEFAVANQHSVTGHPGGETLAPMESYTRRANEALKEYNAELEKLQQKLKNGEISQEQYGASVKRVESSIKLVNDELEYFVSNQSEKTTESFTRQRNLLDSVSDAYKEMVEDAIQVYGELSGKEARQIDQLNKLEQESKDLAAAQKELSDGYKNGDITQRQYVNASRALSIQQGEVKKRISDVNGEIQRNNAVEREAIGSIAQKTARLTQLQHQYNKLSEAQRNNEAVGGKLRAEYQKLSAETQKLNQSLSGTKAGGIGQLFTSIRGIAGTMGIAFGAYQLVNFGKELFNIAKQAEGIELRFAKIGDTQGLEKLRTATKNTVSDLELMKLAVRADNFRIPMDVLAKGLEFARRRANDTGQSVDYMTNSFVDGLGRKSSLVLDNLGISLVEIQEEVKKVGDYNVAVGNIIEREMQRAGSDVDTLSDKTNKLATEWQNFAKRISGVWSAIFNSGAPSSGQIEKLTEAYKKQFDALKGFSTNAKNAFIANRQDELNAINKQLKGLSLDSAEFGKIYRAQRGYGGKSPTQLLNDLRKPLIEQEQALQASLVYAKAITDEMSVQERHAQGIYKISELEEKASNARKTLNDAIGDQARAEAQKEVDKWEKLLKKARGDKDKSGPSKEEKELEREKEQHEDLLSRLASMNAEYESMFLDQQEREIKAVENKYDELYDRAVKYNSKLKDSSNMIDLSLIEEGRDQAISNTLRKQQEDQAKKDKEEAERIQKERYAAAYEVAKTHNQRLEEIEQEHQKHVQALGDKANAEQLANLQKVRDEAIKQANETEAEKQSIVLKGTEAQLILTTGALKAQRDAILLLLNDPMLSDGLRLRLEGDLGRINSALDKGARAATLANFKKRQQELTNELKKLEEAGLKNTEVWQKVYAELMHVSREAKEFSNDELTEMLSIVSELVSELGTLGDSLTNLGDAFGNSALSEIGGALSGIAAGLRNITVAFDENATKADKYAAAVQSVIGMISMVANAAAERKRAEEEYYRMVIQLQHDYNMSLIERQRLESQLGEGLYLKDYVGRMQDAMKSGRSAMDEYQTALSKLIETGKVKDGTKNAINWNNVGYGAGAGASVGAAIGSVVPVIGTAVGAVVGAFVGAIGGLFGGKKKKDTYSSLIAQYPELKDYLNADSPQDLADVKNLAQILIANQATDEATKQQLEGIVDFIDEIEAAREQIKDVVKDLTGEIGQDLRSALVQAFRDGESAAIAMGKTVEKVLENMLSQLLFNKAFEGIFKEFEDELAAAVEAYTLTGDESHIINAMGDFIDMAGPAAKEFNRWMELARQQAEARGMDIFSGDSDKSKQGEFSKGIQSLTESTGGRIEGEMGGMRLAQLEALQVAKQQQGTMAQQVVIMNNKLAVLNSINQNTGRTADNTDRLVNIETAIVSLNNKISNGDALRRGAGI